MGQDRDGVEWEEIRIGKEAICGHEERQHQGVTATPTAI
jgi:hypothetical protein